MSKKLGYFSVSVMRMQKHDLSTWGSSCFVFCKRYMHENNVPNNKSSVFPLDISQGEICLCTSRIYVERSIYSEFLERFVAAAKKWKTGVPSDPANNNGALISKEHLEKVIIAAL